MKFTKGASANRTLSILLCGTMLAASWSSKTNAQAIDIPVQVPLNDAECSRFGNPNQNRIENCTVDGTRTVTTISETVTTAPDTFDPSVTRTTINGTYQVDFNGNLALDGIPVNTSTTSSQPFNTPVWVYIPDIAEVNATLQYVGEYRQSYVEAYGQQPIPASSLTDFRRISNTTLTANSIDVNTNGSSFNDPNTGDTVTVSISTPDPTAITNNSVNFGGKFQQTGSRIVFGTLEGTATVITAPSGDYVLTESPIITDEGLPDGAWISPAAMQYDVALEVKTVLDENGLITPKIAVTDGIELNNSKITGVAQATEGTDAVNLDQMNAAIAAVGGGTASNPYV